MTGSLRAVCTCLLAALVTVSVTCCSRPPDSGGGGDPRATAATSILCDNAEMRVASSVSYTDDAGKMWVVGELINTSQADMLLPRICINIRSASGERTEQRFAGPILIKASERIGFWALIENAPTGGNVNVSFTADAEPVYTRADFARTVSRDFDVTASAALAQHEGKIALVTGIVTNTGPSPVTNVFVSVGLYNEQDVLVGVGEGKVTGLEALDPGGSIHFAMASSRLRQSLLGFKLRVLAEAQIAEPNSILDAASTGSASTTGEEEQDAGPPVTDEATEQRPDQ